MEGNWMKMNRSVRYLRCGIALAVLTIALSAVQAVDVTLSWDANKETDIVGYRVYRGGGNRKYSTNSLVGKVTSYPVRNFAAGGVFYFSVTALNSAGLESDFSNEVILTTSETRLSASVLPSKRFQIVAQGVPGKTYSVQASSDLRTWVKVGSPIADQTTGQLTFADNAFPELSWRFYKAEQQ